MWVWFAVLATFAVALCLGFAAGVLNADARNEKTKLRQIREL